jgi:iron-sulfur cluster assembly accessory protein
MPDEATTTADVQPQITISERAAMRITQFLNDDPELAAMRVGVSGGGCSGFQYTFELVQSVAPDDVIFRNGFAVIAVDPVSLPYMAGAEIDLVENLMGESFQVNNPQATASCGCGTSFSV